MTSADLFRASGSVVGLSGSSDCAVSEVRKTSKKRCRSPYPCDSFARSGYTRVEWDPRDPTQMRAVKEVLHVATAPGSVPCRDEERKRVLDFCKDCVEREKGGSIYVCGCPGTGKTLSILKLRDELASWSSKMGFVAPDDLVVNCTSLVRTSDIFSKILSKFQLDDASSNLSPLRRLQDIFSCSQTSSRRMILLVVDELDYLITKDRAVLHDLFMLTSFPFSRCILIGIANAIDLADRFLPKLESLNCKPAVVTFRAYSKDQIIQIIRQRLLVLGYDVFEPSALEFCARKIAAASGDMRKALGVCRTAVEVFEEELKNLEHKTVDRVTFEHMDTAVSKAFKSTVLDNLLSLPQHQQMILCAFANLFCRRKKSPTLGELNVSYSDVCKSARVPGVGMQEFANLCRVLSDQGLVKIGQSKEDKLRKVALQIDCSDITFAFKGSRFFQNCLDK